MHRSNSAGNRGRQFFSVAPHSLICLELLPVNSTLPNRASSTRVGFTLVEMLIVITIIAVMVSLLLPAVKRSKGVALRARCQSNLRQWLTAMITYQSDFGVLPYAMVQNTSWSDQWNRTLRNYVSCSMTESEQGLGCPLGKNVMNAESWTAYHINGNVASRCHMVGDHHPETAYLDQMVRYDLVTKPGMTPMFHDAGLVGSSIYVSMFGEGTDLVTPANTEHWTWVDVRGSNMAFRHLNTANLVMLDGHVESLAGRYQGEFFPFNANSNTPNDPDALYAEGKPFFWHYRRDPYRVY